MLVFCLNHKVSWYPWLSLNDEQMSPFIYLVFLLTFTFVSFVSSHRRELSHGSDFIVSMWTSSISGFCVSGFFSFGHFWIYVFCMCVTHKTGCPRGSYFSSNNEPYACIWFSHSSPQEQTIWITITHSVLLLHICCIYNSVHTHNISQCVIVMNSVKPCFENELVSV